MRRKPVIRTYEDLLREEQRLTQDIQGHKALLRQDFHGLKEHARPLVKTATFLNKLATRDHTGPLSNFGIDFGIDLIVRKLILGRASWLTRIVVPFIVKNYSSHIVNEESRAKFAQKIQGLFSKLRNKKKKGADASKTKTTDGMN